MCLSPALSQDTQQGKHHEQEAACAHVHRSIWLTLSCSQCERLVRASGAFARRSHVSRHSTRHDARWLCHRAALAHRIRASHAQGLTQCTSGASEFMLFHPHRAFSALVDYHSLNAASNNSKGPIMWTFQFVSLQYALIVSIDYRCSDNHLIHERTLTFPLDAKDDIVQRIERNAGHDAAVAYAQWRH